MVGQCENSGRPLVSVILPAYNAQQYIVQAVRSVQAQTMPHWELIVLDDGSRDGTCALVEQLAAEDPRIILLRNGENLGVARTRNRGFDLCRGTYVALLDSDDVWHPKKLEKQLDRLAGTGGDICYTSYAMVDAAGKKVRADYLVPEEADLDRLLKENVIGCSTVLLKAELVKRYHFNPEYYHEDYVLWVQLLQNGCRAVGCREVLTDWRYIENSRSFDKRRAAEHRWKIYREYLGLPLPKCLILFVFYAAASLKKYLNAG